MAGTEKQETLDLGVSSQRATAAGLSRPEKLAVALSAVWMVGVAAIVLMSQGDTAAAQLESLRFIMTLVAVFLPVAVVWVGVLSARSARTIRDEGARLQASIDAMRLSYVAQQQSVTLANIPSVVEKLDQIVSAQRQTESTIATFATSRPASAPAPMLIKSATLTTARQSYDAQPTLALGTSSEDIAPPLSKADFIRAVNFPENAEDKEGFAALRRALKDREASRLIQSAQDVLTLLSQDGIYMDDLRPDRARPDIWRQFANGERGRTVAVIGGIRDRSCLALTAGRMRQDPIFRDTSHHFLRQFDKTFSVFEADATDMEIAEITDTRTARAFMLLGRVSGTFD
ncbi:MULTISPECIES: hypothetical protein [Falsihalocynthiibacter]|uniref:hypothetical protein n=1 Tax=Falsihalocynthiibacter TaxID=2854182 RepID=UPI0030025019